MFLVNEKIFASIFMLLMLHCFVQIRPTWFRAEVIIKFISSCGRTLNEICILLVKVKGTCLSFYTVFLALYHNIECIVHCMLFTSCCKLVPQKPYSIIYLFSVHTVQSCHYLTECNEVKPSL